MLSEIVFWNCRSVNPWPVSHDKSSMMVSTSTTNNINRLNNNLVYPAESSIVSPSPLVGPSSRDSFNGNHHRKESNGNAATQQQQSLSPSSSSFNYSWLPDHSQHPHRHHLNNTSRSISNSSISTSSTSPSPSSSSSSSSVVNGGSGNINSGSTRGSLIPYNSSYGSCNSHDGTGGKGGGGAGSDFLNGNLPKRTDKGFFDIHHSDGFHRTGSGTAKFCNNVDTDVILKKIFTHNHRFIQSIGKNTNSNNRKTQQQQTCTCFIHLILLEVAYVYSHVFAWSEEENS